MNNPFRYRPSPLMAALSCEVIRAIAADPVLDGVFRQGKMLGILIHSRGWTIAYSGKRIPAAAGLRLPVPSLRDGLPAMSSEYADLPFVPPVFDVSGGVFAQKEKEISELSAKIASCAQNPDGEEANRLKLERAMLSVKLQKWTFSQYRLLNARGEEKSVLEIFAAKGVLPPAAAGDCAAPKLLQHAFLNGREPLEIGEFWYGASPSGPVRATGRFYPSCSWKCGPILDFMLQGLDVPSGVVSDGEPKVLMEDEAVVVADKPSGMPSVPGLDGLMSLQEWLAGRCTSGEGIFQVHRLDQDTSGLMVFAKSRRFQADLQRQFEERTVQKTYVAVVGTPDASAAGVPSTPYASEGVLDLPLAPDHEDKPRQKVDPVQGKPAVTEYRFASGDEAAGIFRHFGLDPFSAESRALGLRAVVFRPRTGRSHQLRVHSAHPLGLASPIAGDTLYGGASGLGPLSSRRLCLHASGLIFRHPVSGEILDFKSP
ncbi:MAG: RluA family pseudouridine synthase [Candidatus Cryptobacteroides sp.]